MGVHEHRQHKALGVPERVPVVAGPGQALGRDRPELGPRPGLQDVEQPEAHRLLDLGVAVHLDVGAFPELVQVLLLLGQQAIPAGQVGAGERADHLIDEGGPGPPARPAVADVLHDVQLLTGRHLGRDRGPAQVGVGLVAGGHLGRPGYLMRHPGRDPQPADARLMHKQRPGRSPVGRFVLLADQRRLQDGRQAGILAGLRQLLVGDELGLHHQRNRAAEGLDVVADRRDRPLREGHRPGGGDPDRAPGRASAVRGDGDVPDRAVRQAHRAHHR